MTKPARRAVQVQVSDLILQVVKAGRDSDLIRLGATLPPAELFPLRELNRIAASVGRRSPITANSFDAPPGNHALRVQIARRAMEAGCMLAPDDIITTVGATEALNLCLRAVAKPSSASCKSSSRSACASVKSLPSPVMASASTSWNRV
jgi:DNA-binding transcriptional MocR family regulator